MRFHSVISHPNLSELASELGLFLSPDSKADAQGMETPWRSNHLKPTTFGLEVVADHFFIQLVFHQTSPTDPRSSSEWRMDGERHHETVTYTS